MASKKPQLSQKPAAVKLRTMRRNRTEEEKLKERIRAQRQSSIRKAKTIISRSTWALLNIGDKSNVWAAIENEIREKFAEVAAAGDDSLSSSKEAETAVYKMFDKHIHIFVMEGEDEPVLCELFQPGCLGDIY